jgi:two-component sensor histidine kinase
MLADVITVVAELVGNSIRHASGLYGDVIRVAWSIRYVGGAQIVDVRVTDGGGSGSPHRRVHDVASPDGRGMAIVEALATTWGVDRDGLGQCVWAEVTGPISSGRSVG